MLLTLRLTFLDEEQEVEEGTLPLEGELDYDRALERVRPLTKPLIV